MAEGFSEEWARNLSKVQESDTDFQQKVDKLNRSFDVHILPSPEHGVTEDRYFSISFPSCGYHWGKAPAPWGESEYEMEGKYESFYRVNEGIVGLVPALMEQDILLPKGSISYLARFLPAIERYFALSRQETDSYPGDFELSDQRPD